MYQQAMNVAEMPTIETAVDQPQMHVSDLIEQYTTFDEATLRMIAAKNLGASVVGSTANRTGSYLVPETDHDPKGLEAARKIAEAFNDQLNFKDVKVLEDEDPSRIAEFLLSGIRKSRRI